MRDQSNLETCHTERSRNSRGLYYSIVLYCSHPFEAIFDSIGWTSQAVNNLISEMNMSQPSCVAKMDSKVPKIIYLVGIKVMGS